MRKSRIDFRKKLKKCPLQKAIIVLEEIFILTKNSTQT